MAVQLIGTKHSAEKWIYEIHLYNKNQSRRKYTFTDNCTSNVECIKDVFDSKRCAVLPLAYINSFVNNGSVTFKVFVKSLYERKPFNSNTDSNQGGRVRNWSHMRGAYQPRLYLNETVWHIFCFLQNVWRHNNVSTTRLSVCLSTVWYYNICLYSKNASYTTCIHRQNNLCHIYFSLFWLERTYTKTYFKMLDLKKNQYIGIWVNLIRPIHPYSPSDRFSEWQSFYHFIKKLG